MATFTNRLKLAKQTFRDLLWHTALDQGFDDADARLLKISSDFGDEPDPNAGVVVDGDFVGQIYQDETVTPPRRWICTTAGTPPAGVWELLNTNSVEASAPINGNTVLETILQDFESRINTNLLEVAKRDQRNFLYNPYFNISTRTGYSTGGGNASFGPLHTHGKVRADHFGRVYDRWVYLTQAGAGTSQLTTSGYTGLGWKPGVGVKSAICQLYEINDMQQIAYGGAQDENGTADVKISISLAAKVLGTGAVLDPTLDEHFTVVVLRHSSGSAFVDPIAAWNLDGDEPSWHANYTREVFQEVTPNNSLETDEFKVFKVEDITLPTAGSYIFMLLSNTTQSINANDLIYVRFMTAVVGDTISHIPNTLSPLEERQKCRSYCWKTGADSRVPANHWDVDHYVPGALPEFSGVIIAPLHGESVLRNIVADIRFPVPMYRSPTVTLNTPKTVSFGAPSDPNPGEFVLTSGYTDNVAIDSVNFNQRAKVYNSTNYSCNIRSDIGEDDFEEGAACIIHAFFDSESFGTPIDYVYAP